MSLRRTSWLVVPLLLALVLSGCGGTDESDLKEFDGTASSSPSTTASASASPTEAGEVFDDEGNSALRGTIDASGAEQEAVVDAWFAYWTARTKSYYDAAVDPQLGSVAAGKAVSDVVQYVAYLKRKKLRTVGDTKFSVQDVKVTGSTATLRSCGENKSLDRSADGTPAEQPTPFYNLEGDLTQAGGGWRVVEIRVLGTTPCRS